MTKRNFICIVAAMAAVFAAGTPVFASAWGFGTASGSNAAFAWSNGDHLDAVADSTAFGSPTVDNYGFFFQNGYGDMSFNADSVTRPFIDASTQSDVDIAGSTPGGALPINQIIIREGGTWGVEAGFNPEDLLFVAASFYLNEHVTNDFTNVIPLPAATFHPDGTWSIEFTLTYSDAYAQRVVGSFPNAPFTAFDWQFTNQLFAFGSTSDTFINKTYAHIIFPEPASLAFLGLACPLVLRRSRK